jgi:dihydroorotate dehydrogenase electron transfer subunit
MTAYEVKVLKKLWFNKKIFGLEFSLPNIHPRPGQFLQVRVNESLLPFLNRPISIASYNKSRVLLLIKIVGKGTEILSQKKKGDRIVLFGPYGKGIIPQRKRSLLLAGGIGIAPLYFLAQTLQKRRTKFSIIFGTKTSDELILKEELTKLADESIFVTEMGRKKQTVVSIVQQIDLQKYDIFYTCGPKEMLIELQKLPLPDPCYAFCEDQMGCGCGLCLGCAIMYQGRYRRICEDGPVFELGGIDFGM